jgi:hypothetical protein
MEETGKMIKEEPKSPKGEKEGEIIGTFHYDFVNQKETYTPVDEKTKGDKASLDGSQKYWIKYGEKLEHRIADSCLLSLNKEFYDKLVSLEAKIEVLKGIRYIDPERIESRIYQYQSEYDQLLKEHNL